MSTRMTRAQRAQNAVESTDAIESKERAPLNEISSNASPEQAVPEEELPKKTPVRSKSKKGAKGKKGKKGKATKQEEEQAQGLPEDEPQASGCQMSDAAVEDPSQDIPSGKQQVRYKR
jgi:hypothetical protein